MNTEIVTIIEPSKDVFEKAQYYIDLVQKIVPEAKVTLVGSLAVPLCIKNEIDVLVEVGRGVSIESVQNRLTDPDIGIFNVGVTLDDSGFNRSKKKLGLICELHILYEGDPRVQSYLDHVERLKTDTKLAESYADLKWSLNGVTIEKYKLEKEQFFKRYNFRK